MLASTGLRNYLLGTGSFKSAFNLSFIKIYSGTPPATADAAVSGTLLVTISNNSTGTGLTFGTPADGVVSKTGAETWSGLIASSGTAAYFRLVTGTDTGVSSTTEVRLQGTVALAGGDIDLASLSLTASATQTLPYFSVALPAL